MRLLSGGVALVAGVALASAVSLVSVAGPAVADPSTGGTRLVTETFEGATVADAAWQALGSACLTAATAATAGSIPDCSSYRSAGAANPLPALGAAPGYLQLTDAGANRSGSVLFNRPLPASEGISVTFTTYQYGSTSQVGADGIGFYLVDGATDLTQPGADGGSLGYAQRLQTEAHLPDETLPGVTGGYLGVGLDVFGNNVNDGESRGAGCAQRSPWQANLQRAPDTITVRGPGSGTEGYCFLASTTAPNPPNPGYLQVAGTTLHGPGTLGAPSLAASERRVNVEVTPAPAPRVVVQVQYPGDSTWYVELDVPAPADGPSTYKFGLSASTGSQTDIHLIRDIAVDTYAPLPQVDLVKQVDLANPLPSPLQVGSPIPYQYVVTNAGATTLTDLAIVDDRLTGVVCPTDPLPPAGAQAAVVVCTGVYTVTAADVAAGEVTNVAHAEAASDAGGAVTSNDSTVTVPLDSGITLDKTVVTPAPYRPGQDVDYAYLVRNVGQVAVSGLVVTDDRIAAPGRATCPSDTLGVGDEVTCTATIPVDAARIDSTGHLVNTATATGVSALNQELRATDDASIAVATDIAVTKEVDDGEPTVGSTVTFTVTAANRGPADATDVVVRDLLPLDELTFVSATPQAGSTYDPTTGRWTIPALAVGAQATLQIVASVDTTRTAANTAELLSVDQGDVDPGNDNATVVVNGQLHDIEVSKSVANGVTSIRLGQEATFVVRATNVGTVAEGAVVVHDALPPGLELVAASPAGAYDAASGLWTVGTLPPGASAVLELTVRGAQVGGIANVAALESSVPDDENPLNDESVATLDVGPRQADLSVTKAAFGPAPVLPGGELTYVLTVSNAGPDDAPGTLVTDPGAPGITRTAISQAPTQGTFDVATGAWDVGTLVAGGSASVALTATVDADTVGTRTNTATVVPGAGVDDPDPDNNTAAETVVVTEPAPPAPPIVDVGVQITVASNSGAPLDAVPVGDTVTFTLRATNVGVAGAPPTAVTDAVFHTSLPALVSFLSSDGDGTFAGSAADAELVWSVPTIAPGATLTRTIQARAVATGQVVAPLSLASLAQADSDPDNNVDSASLVVVEGAQLSVTKVASPTVARPDEDVTFTVTVTNGGTGPADQVAVGEALPADGTVVSATPSVGTFDAALRRWSVGPLGAGASAELVVVLRFATTGLHANAAVIEQAGGPVPEGDGAVAQVFVPAADLVVDKTVDDPSPPVGQEVRFTVGVTNLGPDPSTAVAVRDVLPAGLVYVSSVASQGGYDPSTGLWTIGDLEPVLLPHLGPAQVELTLVARASTVGTHVNAATVVTHEQSTFDPDASNDSASAALAAGPTVTEPPPTVTPTPDGAAGGGLATTGADVVALVALAVACLLAGWFVLIVRRRVHRGR